MQARRGDVVVIGGGLVGLALAYELAALGAGVVVVDGSHAGRATDAGAGILSPATSVEAEPELWPFLLRCGAHYPHLLTRVASDGADVVPAAYARCGVLSLCLQAHEEQWFAPFSEMVQQRASAEVSEITATEARGLFPPLGRVHRTLFAPGSARVDGRGLAAALRQAAEARGVAVVEDTVTGLTWRGGARRRVEAVRMGIGPDVRCDALAVAGGAWSTAVGEWLGQPLPVGPTKGQIVHLGLDDRTGEWPIAQPLLTHYIVPWPGGRVACGGTFEAGAGFSVDVTAAGLHELLRECLAVAPGLRQARYLETRVGLRPTSPDDRALVGRVPGWDNAWVATGHGANGLLQGPYSARLLAHEVAGAALPPDEPVLPAFFDPARFA